MTTKHELLTAVNTKPMGETTFAEVSDIFCNELPVLLSLVKRQHEALRTCTWITDSNDHDWMKFDEVKTKQAIIAYNEWNEGENQC